MSGKFINLLFFSYFLMGLILLSELMLAMYFRIQVFFCWGRNTFKSYMYIPQQDLPYCILMKHIYISTLKFMNIYKKYIF